MYKFIQPSLKLNVSEKKEKCLRSDRMYLFLSTHDGGACGFWRSRFISLELESQYHENCACTESRTFLYDQKLLRQACSYRIQRCCRPDELNWLRYVRECGRCKVIYDIDDILCYEDMPEYNSYRKFFTSAADNIEQFMKSVDVITVTNKFLVEYYANRFNISPEKFCIIPNYLPRYWLGNYHPLLVSERYEQQKNRKLRIGLAATPTHFARENIKDDCSGIADWIIANRKKYQFVFKGGISSYLEPYKDDFEIYPVSRFLIYPKEKVEMDVDLMIQPLQDNFFNRCKSPIKLYESWADGMPCFVQGLPNYREVAADCCFDNFDDLEKMIEEIFKSKNHYCNVVDANYHRLDDLWLDKNLQSWINVML